MRDSVYRSILSKGVESRYKMKKRPEELESGLLNPDMTDQCIRLHMGELTSDEILVARAAIRWANERINQYL